MKRFSMALFMLIAIIVSFFVPAPGLAGGEVDRPEGLSLHSETGHTHHPPLLTSPHKEGEEKKVGQEAPDSPQEAEGKYEEVPPPLMGGGKGEGEKREGAKGEGEQRGFPSESGKESGINLSPRTYALGGYPRATLLTDLDRDGDPDILVTNPDSHNITILLNQGDGTFETGDTYPVDGYPISLLSIDIDGDSDTDLVALDSEGWVRTLLQDGGESRNGVPSFLKGGDYPAEEYSFSLRPHDVDQDGDPDLIVSSPERTIILLNSGKGDFSGRLSYKGGAASPVNRTIDLNSDEKGDMIIGGMEGISVVVNMGDDTFEKGVYYPTGKMPVAVAAGDLDSDLDSDLVVANYKSHTLSILINNGDGTFQKAVDYPTGKGPNSLSMEDIDGDEDMDIIVTNGPGGDLTIFVNNTVRPLAITTDELPQGHNGQVYETKLEAGGGVPPYQWSVVSGSPPPGVVLDPETGEMVSLSSHGEESGVIEGGGGTPLVNFSPPCYCLKAPLGLYRFTVEVADSSSNKATAELYIEVLPTPGTIAGKVSYQGEKRGTVRIGLWLPTQGSLMWLVGNPIYNRSVTTPGEYKLDNIYPESYLVSAYLDTNDNGRRDNDEPFGAFGSKDKPEAVVVDNAAELTGIDIELVEKN